MIPFKALWCVASRCGRHTLQEGRIWGLPQLSYYRRLCTPSTRPIASDPYSILEIPKDASQTHVKLAYYRLAKQYHPDRNREAGAKDRFEQVYCPCFALALPYNLFPIGIPPQQPLVPSRWVGRMQS